MGRLRTLLTNGALGALALSAIAAPAAAADTKGTLAIANGIPGTRVDVCLNGKEIKSGLPYGGKVLKDVVSTGKKNLKFYARDARTCRGSRLAKRSFPLGPGDDATIVVTKHAPRVVIFGNLGLGEIPPLGTPTKFASFAYRNAADVAADFSIHIWGVPGADVPVNPSGIFTKGQEATGTGLNPGNAFRFRAAIGGDPELIVSPIIELVQSRRYEWILVGTKHANARFVFLDRLVSNPSP